MRLTRKIALLFLAGFALALALQAGIDIHRELSLFDQVAANQSAAMFSSAPSVRSQFLRVLLGDHALGLLFVLGVAALPSVILIARYLRNELSRHRVAEALVLTEATRRMADLEEAHLADRVETVKKIASMAHELGTPLAVVQAHAQMMAAGEVDEPELEKTAQVMLQQTQRMTQMVIDVLHLARAKTGTKTAIDLAVVARQTVSLLAPLANIRHMHLNLVGEASKAVVLGEPSKLLQILTNLTMNAQQSMRDGGTVTLTVGTQQATRPRAKPEEAPGDHDADEGEGQRAEYRFVSVRDGGTGISKKDLPRIFESFFTTKKSRGGTGLGLAVSYRIASEHEGWIDVSSRPGKGSCFTLYLPAVAA